MKYQQVSLQPMFALWKYIFLHDAIAKFFYSLTNVLIFLTVISSTRCIELQQLVLFDQKRLTEERISFRELNNDELHLMIQRCIAQNPYAQKQLYERYNRFIKSIVVRYIKDQETAKEVLNDIFYRIFQKLHLYKPIAPFEAWIKKVAVNTVLNKVKQKINVSTAQIDQFSEDVSISPDVIDKIGYHELIRILFDLPDVQRTVFNLYVFEDFSHKEIGSLLSITEGNSRWHLNQARQKLKATLLNSFKR